MSVNLMTTPELLNYLFNIGIVPKLPPTLEVEKTNGLFQRLKQKTYFSLQRKISGNLERQLAQRIIELSKTSIDETIKQLARDYIKYEESFGGKSYLIPEISSLRALLSYDDNCRRLETEFSKGMYLRTFSDAQDELDKTIKPKFNAERDAAFIEPWYWSSASTILQGLRIKMWIPEGGEPRCGLLLSSRAQLGGWNYTDMATANPPEGISTEDNKAYFPRNYPPISMALLNELYKNPDFVRAALGKSDVSMLSDWDYDTVTEMLFDETKKARILSILPEKYKSIFTFEEVKTRMQTAKSETAPTDPMIDYNEAKIRYLPRDILGVIYIQRDATSIQKAIKLHEELKKLNIHVPFVIYNPEKGSITIKRSI